MTRTPAFTPSPRPVARTSRIAHHRVPFWPNGLMNFTSDLQLVAGALLLMALPARLAALVAL